MNHLKKKNFFFFSFMHISSPKNCNWCTHTYGKHCISFTSAGANVWFMPVHLEVMVGDFNNRDYTAFAQATRWQSSPLCWHYHPDVYVLLMCACVAEQKRWATVQTMTEKRSEGRLIGKLKLTNGRGTLCRLSHWRCVNAPTSVVALIRMCHFTRQSHPG